MNPKHTYETTFIVNASLEDANIEPVVNGTIDFIQNNGGTITTLDKWGRRRLAYPIQKKHNGYYVYVMYEAPPTLLPQLERYFQLEENVLRHLSIKMNGHAIEFRKQFLQNRHDLLLETAAAETAAATADGGDDAVETTISDASVA
ncbi:MAG: 30S ribosomal protein S6 [Candidatus Kapaibacteriota bacterium]|jgi:small subunit ribosomal protein S6